LSRAVSELEPMVDRYKSQIATLQSAVEVEREAKERAAIERIEGLELLRAELRSTAAKLDAATQRADTQEKMLLASRNNYREKLEELRTVERSVIDMTMQLANITRRAETAETDKAALLARVSDLEAVERGFEQRLSEINKLLAEKETALLLARDQITFETSRLEEMQNIARAERTRYEAEIVELVRMLDKERVNRTVVEGALLSSRRRHMTRGEEAGDNVTPLENEATHLTADASPAQTDVQNDVEPRAVAEDAEETGAIILEFERTSGTSSPDIEPPVTSLRMSLVEDTGQAAPAAS
jgi:chromosome segregation ATPase